MSAQTTSIPAVILAAGEGSRLRGGDHAHPKPLTPLLGLTLLERSILSCREAGVREFLVVVGYRKEEILPHVERLQERHGVTIQVVENPDWEAGNGTSVAACAPYVSGPFLVLMSDHLFEPGLLERLMAADNGSGGCLLAVDRRLADIFDFDDATLVRLEGEDVTAIGKGLEEPDAVDTGFFLCRPVLFEALAKARKEGDGSLSGGIRRLTGDGRIRAVDIDGHFWFDVDTPEAIEAGEERLMARLKGAKRIDGPVSRHINRFFSLKITRRLAPYPITPNQVSVASCALGFLGAAFFFAMSLTAGHPWLAWLLAATAGLIVQASSILDGVDGEIARLKHQVTPYGAYFDYILDRYVDGLILIGMVYSSYVLSGSFSIIIVGFVALMGLPLSSVHRAKFLAKAKRNYLDEDDGLLRYFPHSRDVRLFVIFLGGIFNQLKLAIYFLAIVPNVVTLLRLYTVKKALE
ncbi:MAG: NTP transferase domain-containing protein [bacterium]|nr:NTP transferase domain-containing protein [bacterium]